MRRKAILMMAVLALTLAVVGMSNAKLTSSATAAEAEEHTWTYKPGDLIWYNSEYFVVWKRMEAIHRITLELHCFYQIAPEGSMVGEWVKEGELDPMNIKGGGTTKGGGDPKPGYCPPEWEVPEPCIGG